MSRGGGGMEGAADPSRLLGGKKGVVVQVAPSHMLAAATPLGTPHACSSHTPWVGCGAEMDPHGTVETAAAAAAWPLSSPSARCIHAPSLRHPSQGLLEAPTPAQIRVHQRPPHRPPPLQLQLLVPRGPISTPSSPRTARVPLEPNPGAFHGRTHGLPKAAQHARSTARS